VGMEGGINGRMPMAVGRTYRCVKMKCKWPHLVSQMEEAVAAFRSVVECLLPFSGKREDEAAIQNHEKAQP